MKFIKTLMLAFAVIMIVVSCDNKPSQSPADIQTSIMEALRNNDYDKMVTLLIDNVSDKSLAKELKEGLTMRSKSLQQINNDKGGIKDFKISEEIDGDNAKVTIVTIYGNNDEDTEVVNYKKNGGKWGIVFM